MQHDDALRCVLMGTESLLIHCAETLLRNGHVIAHIVSSDGQIGKFAAEREIPLLAPHADLAEALGAVPFDYFFSITNFEIVPSAVLGLPRRLAINFHDGPLPRYAGLNVTSWALLEGAKSHGICWHVMRERVDAGDVLKWVEIPIDDDETSFTLNTKCYEQGFQSFEELVDELTSGRAEPRSQDLGERRYYGKHKRPEAAATLSWDRPARELGALVRALDFGPYANPLGLPKLVVAGEILYVTAAEPVDGRPDAPPGTIMHAGADAITIATGDGELALRALRGPDGSPLSVADAQARLGLRAGGSLRSLDPGDAARLGAVNEALARHESFWLRRLGSAEPIELSFGDRSAALGPSSTREQTMDVPAGLLETTRARPDVLLLGAAAYLSRLTDRSAFDLLFRDPALARTLAGVEPFFAPYVPLRVALDPRQTFADADATLTAELAEVRKRGSFARDLVLRHPSMRGKGEGLGRVVVALVDSFEELSLPDGCELAIFARADGTACRFLHDARVFATEIMAALPAQLAAFLVAATVDPTCPLGRLPLVTEETRRRQLVEWNATETSYPGDLCVHQAFEAQVARTPDAVALVFERASLTYRELDARANQLGHRLRQLGVGPDVLVGVCLERSLELVVGILAVHKAGGAYVPLDPTYPKDRLATMVEDSAVPVLLTQRRLVAGLPEHHAAVVVVDEGSVEIASQPATAIDVAETGVGPANLAYVIYTSGSTGKPKGVMVEHRNVVSFFAGMDQRVPHDPPGTWLAVTSLSFDISVLELFWTLTRGFKVVLYLDRAAGLARAGETPRRAHARKPIDFSLFYFASDEGEGVADKYRLLLEGAKFGDRHGFAAVWTPERHFHAFGGLYPNPSVASAAIATITERIQIRAGSCVLPLHSPIRVAEEWALVDNLSHGRVGISFASGWQPNDFVIAPERFADRKDIMFRDIDTVRRLWRGESITLRAPTGKDVEIRTLPRPVQKELPVWVTAAGNPETFQAAAEIGASLLTHLLGQTFAEVAEKVAIYRAAWKKAGHAGAGHVTIMLHTFVGPDEDVVRETVRQPMKGYLRSAVNLIRAAAWTFPTFKQKAEATGKTPAEIFESQDLSTEDMDALLDFSFERYYRTSGLFGTPEACAELIDQIKGIDIDEVACLIDYGVPSKVVLEHLPYLNQVREASVADTVTTSDGDGDDDVSLAAQLRRHGVTHLQCTPSMMTMILGQPDARAALAGLQTILIGGEAFPVALARDLRQATPAKIFNMYGPTETTIWSSTHPVDPAAGNIPIGRPIANTELYVLDRNLEPVPVGVAGELLIGGAGVVRGYLNRPELTAERFIPHPFRPGVGARLYRTGDLARHAPDGTVEFLGRLDHQVKIRGHRIELGEIEAVLGQQPGVREAVVIAREDSPGDRRLVGYLRALPGQAISIANVRAALRDKLPEAMVPSHLVVLDAFPLTPNAKIDRKALPPPGQLKASPESVYVRPESELEQTIARIWQEVLNVKTIGMEDNFFDLGGHSLLTVQAHRRLKEATGQEIALTDLFRFPTIRRLVGHLGHAGDAGAAVLETSQRRADARKDAMSRRQELLKKRRSPKES